MKRALAAAVIVLAPAALAMAANPNENARRPRHIEILPSKLPFPEVFGRTDLPDGTTIYVRVDKPQLPNSAGLLAQGRAACQDACIPAQGPNDILERATVRGGAFGVGPFSWQGKPFKAGIYTVRIFLENLPGESLTDSPAGIHELGLRMKQPIASPKLSVRP